MAGAAAPRVAILLATFNGARFLPAQLQSFVVQSMADWVLYWRDDGSSDGTVAVMEAFAASAGAGRCVHVSEPPGRLGPTGNFMALLRAAAHVGAVAFADQDDVWLPDKLAIGLGQLGDAEPTLYCSRQLLVDEELRPLGESAPLRPPPPFPAALTQNIATGCTVLLNQPAAGLIARSRPPSSSLHDWWSYLVVSAHGGRLVTDSTPTVLYRQHRGNVVGAPLSMRQRAVAALRRGPDVFMAVLQAHVAALRAQPDLLSPAALAALETVHRGLRGGMRQRLAALRLGGMQRQTWQETLLFRCWFLLGARRGRVLESVP